MRRHVGCWMWESCWRVTEERERCVCVCESFGKVDVQAVVNKCTKRYIPCWWRLTVYYVTRSDSSEHTIPNTSFRSVTHGLGELWCGWFATCNGIESAPPPIFAPTLVIYHFVICQSGAPCPASLPKSTTGTCDRSVQRVIVGVAALCVVVTSRWRHPASNTTASANRIACTLWASTLAGHATRRIGTSSGGGAALAWSRGIGPVPNVGQDPIFINGFDDEWTATFISSSGSNKSKVEARPPKNETLYWAPAVVSPHTVGLCVWHDMLAVDRSLRRDLLQAYGYHSDNVFTASRSVAICSSSTPSMCCIVFVTLRPCFVSVMEIWRLCDRSS